MVPALGDQETAKLLLKELVYDLRATVSRWATLTKQTAQPRMGYVGQHLASVVTGLEGSKSGARGYDLLGPAGSNEGEVKTCNRVDQLGSCENCSKRVAAHEPTCPNCGSASIDRKDDSKWLLSFSNDKKFEEIRSPSHYYLVLLEPDDKQNPTLINAKIWRVDPKEPGFALCMAEYYLPKRSKVPRAPFNWWPDSLKFKLMQPVLIFHGEIALADGSVNIVVFSPDATEPETLLPLSANAPTLTKDKLLELNRLLALPATIKKGWLKAQMFDALDASIKVSAPTESDVRSAVIRVMYAATVRTELAGMPQTDFYKRLRAMV